MIGVTFFLDRLIKELSRGDLSDHFGEMPHRAISRDLIVLNPLSGSNEGGVSHGSISSVEDHIVALFDKRTDRLAPDWIDGGDCRIDSFRLTQNLLEACHVNFGFL